MSKLELINKQALLAKLPEICRHNHGCEPPYEFGAECKGCEVYELFNMITTMRNPINGEVIE